MTNGTRMQPQHKPCSSTESNNPIYQRSYRASRASINLCESVCPSVCSARRSFEELAPPLIDITTHSLPISFLYRRRIHIHYFNLMYSNPHELKTGREGSSGKNNSLIRFMNIDSQKCSKTLFVHPKGSLILFLL